MKNQIQAAEWYTAPFIITHLKTCFLKKGFRMVKDDQPADNNSIVFSRLLSKERVEIRGVFPEKNLPETGQPADDVNNGIFEIMMYALDVTLAPISSFTNDNKKSICLPGLLQYEEVVEKLRDYFISNNLELKVYFVYQDGAVKFVHLKKEKDKIKSIEKSMD